MCQAWKQERFDLAEHLFQKTARLQHHADPATAERLADVLYEMGKEQLSKQSGQMAVRWLERAYDALAEQDLDRLSNDAGELRLSIMHSLVRAFLILQTAEAKAKAWDLVRIMENDFGEKMVVSFLKLELLSDEAELDAEAYGQILETIARTVVLTEVSFKTLLHHIHKIRDGNALIACRVLDQLLEARLFDSERQDWIERAITVRIWLVTTLNDTACSLESLGGFLQKASRNLAQPLSSKAAHAVFTLLWKRIEAAYSLSQYEAAGQWCSLTRHHLLEHGGEVNIAIVARKAIQCALARHDDTAVREIFFKMPEATRSAPQTRYLMYKLALRTNDVELASECLEVVSGSSKGDATLLYACVLEAQQSGNRVQAIAALQQTLRKFNYASAREVHLPSLLRCTARLMMAELVSTNPFDHGLLSELCSLFENATGQAKKSNVKKRPIGNEDRFTRPEMEWFAKNTYNFALKHCTDLHPRNLLRLLQCCIELLELLRAEPASNEQEDLLVRLLFCHFLAASASITLARAEDNVEQSAQQYILVQSDAGRFGELLTGTSHETSGSSRYADLQSLHFELLRFQLECAVRLGSWDELDNLLDVCVNQDSVQRLEKLADLIFSIHATLIKSNEGSRHQPKLLSAVEKIVALIWRTSDCDLVKVSRWLRCLFSMALTVDTRISLVCLEQATHLSRQAAGGSRLEVQYPAEEIEWLATTAFNYSVDLYCASDDDACRVWAGKALGLAKASKETEHLYGILQGRYSSLRWDGPE